MPPNRKSIQKEVPNKVPYERYDYLILLVFIHLIARLHKKIRNKLDDKYGSTKSFRLLAQKCR